MSEIIAIIVLVALALGAAAINLANRRHLASLPTDQRAEVAVETASDLRVW